MLFRSEAYNGEAYQEPWVSYTEETSAVTYNKQIWLDLTGYQYPRSINDGVIINPEPKTWPEVNGDMVLVREPNGDVKEYRCQGRHHTEENGYVWDSVQYERSLSDEEINIYQCHGFILTKWFQLYDSGELPLEWTTAFYD